MSVLITVDDFFELTRAYCDMAAQNNIVHAEVFFDPQIHMRRGVSFKTIMHGLIRGLEYAQSLTISMKLIMCVVRDLPEEDAMSMLLESLPYKDYIVALGLDSAEMDNPPRRFQCVFERALDEGFLTVAHAGEEGPPDYIWQALTQLHASRIDHGVQSIDDLKLVHYLADHRIPLTMCPAF